MSLIRSRRPDLGESASDSAIAWRRAAPVATIARSHQSFQSFRSIDNPFR